MTEINHPIDDLLGFIPAGWPMPLGWQQMTAQMSDPCAYWEAEGERLFKLCQKSKGLAYARYNALWNIASTWLHAARLERDILAEIGGKK